DAHILINTAHETGQSLGVVIDADSVQTVVHTGRAAVGNLSRGPDGRLLFAVRVPVKQAGQIRYVLSAMLTPEALAGIVSREFTDSDEWTRSIVDRSGLIVARTRSPERFVGQSVLPAALERLKNNRELTTRDTSLDGQLVYGTFSRSGF